jgi:superfamily II DNA or RNA helicase
VETYLAAGHVVHNCHHLAAKFFVKSADILYGDRLGLTATEKRNDRCEGIVYSHLGPVMYKDTAQEMDPVVYVVQTSATLDALEIPEVTDVGGNVHLGKMRAWLGTKSDRNDCIRKVIDDCRSRSRKVYALTHSPEHAALMSSQYPGSGCITGAVKHADRLDQLASSDLVFASMQVGAEAYNRKDLDVVIFMTSPAANSYTSPVFLQGVGRALRFVPGKPQRASPIA